MQYTYKVKTDGTGFSPKLIEKFDVTDPIHTEEDSTGIFYVINLPNNKVEQFKHLENVKSVEPIIEPIGEYNSRIFPHKGTYKWNNDNFGPLYIPKKGITISIDTANIILYDRIIRIYENNSLEIKGDKIFINGQETKSYTFKMNYYFMMGDNRHNSADSRYWGYVPEDHVVGKPVFVWMSIKEDNKNISTRGQSGFLKKLKRSLFEDPSRRARFFTFVTKDGLSSSYLIHFIVIIAGISGFVYFKNKRAERKN